MQVTILKKLFLRVSLLPQTLGYMSEFTATLFNGLIMLTNSNSRRGQNFMHFVFCSVYFCN